MAHPFMESCFWKINILPPATVLLKLLCNFQYFLMPSEIRFRTTALESQQKERKEKELTSKISAFLPSLHASPECGVGKLSNHFIMFELGKMYDDTS